MSKVNFPKTLYVTEEGDANDKYFLGHEDVGYIDEPQACAVYQLVKVGRVEPRKSAFIEPVKRPK